MNFNGLFLLFGSCTTSFLAAVWVFQAGFGLLAAFFVYAVGGAFLMLAMAALAVFGPTQMKPQLAKRPRAVVGRLVAIRG